MNRIMRRLAGQLGWDRNPLRRRVDKVETAVLTALLVFFLVATSVLIIVATRLTYSTELRQQQAQRSWHEVPATLVQSAASPTAASDGWDGAWVSARWRAPSGQQRTGLVAVGSSAAAGQRVPVWVDGEGRLTNSPLTSYDVWGNVMLAAVIAAICLAVVLSVVGGCVRAVLNRRRLAGWLGLGLACRRSPVDPAALAAAQRLVPAARAPYPVAGVPLALPVPQDHQAAGAGRRPRRYRAHTRATAMPARASRPGRSLPCR